MMEIITPASFRSLRVVLICHFPHDAVFLIYCIAGLYQVGVGVGVSTLSFMLY